MIEVQLLTGARPGEVLIMRGCDLDMTGDVWEFTPPATRQSTTVVAGPSLSGRRPRTSSVHS